MKYFYSTQCRPISYGPGDIVLVECQRGVFWVRKHELKDNPEEDYWSKDRFKKKRKKERIINGGR